MKKIVGLWVLLLSACFPVFSQVDTSYIYNTAMPYGILDIRIAKSDTRYYYLQEDITFSFRESAPGVKTNTFRDMTAWNSAPYKQGNLREKNGNADLFVMNYRVLFPNNYNPAYDPGYPIIIMLHGYGERGNCWDERCYWNTPNWNPNTNSPPAPATATHNLLNNDHNLLHGGLKHLNAVNLAGSKLPNDPAMPTTAFPGFVLFPQVLNGWGQAPKVEDAIRLLRLFIKKYNIDKNRIYIHALSNGGAGLYQAVKRAPWLFAAALPMSAVSNSGIITDGMASEAGKIPLWVFQGGKDINPTPSKTYNTIKGLREAGAVVRYSLYPHLGHGTWNTAYNEPDFFSWILAKRKYNPHVYYGNPVICNTTGAGVRIAFSNGFPAYQWEHDGMVLPNETGSQYIAGIPGTVRGRFSRKVNPSESDWEQWSDPIVVTEINPAKPSIEALGSTHLRGPGLVSNATNNTVRLKSKPLADLYTWYKNGVAVDFSTSDVDDTLRVATFSSGSINANGAYTLKTSYSYCPSPASDPVYLFFNNSAPQNISLGPTAINFKGAVIQSGIFLTWNDVASNELGYEIWRRKVGTTEFKFAGRTLKDEISFYDSPLEPATTYDYKLRAVSNSGASNYIPSSDLNINYQITTAGDQTLPTPPHELKIVSNTLNSITLSWKPSSDNTGIRQYIISYGNGIVNTDTSAASFTITGLPPNTVFPITVKAIDYAGNVSAMSNQLIASTYVLGLFYKHSTGAWEDLDDTTLVATWTSPEFTGTVSNFTIAPRTQEDFFNFQFTGYIDIITEGDYMFRTTSNDGSRLILDDSVLVENDGVHGNITVESDTFHLTTGPHSIEVQYFDYAGANTLTVQYKGPDLNATFTGIPDSLFRSGKYVPAPSPEIPVGLTAQGVDMQQIDLSWQAVAETETEIYRSLSETDSFSILGRASSGVFTDTVGLIPGTTYYYKAKTVISTGVSAFSASVFATTTSDLTAPSVPSSLVLSNKTHTVVTFTWTASTDNVNVTGYEVFSNGILVGTTAIPAFMVTGLMPNTAYNFTVRAIDVSNNKSAFSEALSITTNPSAIYYSMATGNLNEVSTWKQNSNGTGSSPINFAENGQYFMIANRTQTSIGGPWEISGSASKVIVPTGVTLTVDQPFTGKIDLEGTSTLNLNHTSAPELLKISPSSTVNFNTYSSIPLNSYGNVSISGSGIKTFEADTTVIAGNLTVGGDVIFKGAPGNATTLIVNGNVSITGSAGFSSADNRISLRFTENVSHTFSTGVDLYFYQLVTGINSTLNIQNIGEAIKIRLGSLNGGGLTLATGSALNLGINELELAHASVVNAQNESGRIRIDGGDIEITSSSAENSNLYFDAVNNLIDTLSVDLTGNGDVIIREPVNISGIVKIKGGELNSGGYITLLSTASKTAVIAEIENDGVITGNVNVQRYLAPLGDSWRDLSTAVSGVTVAHWQNYFPVTGQFTGASAGTTEPSMYMSTGTAMTPYPATGGSNLAPIAKGRGYATWLNQAAAITMQETGNPFQGNINFSLTGGTGGGASNGWNLIGNPYASPIRWNNNVESWVRSGINNVIAVKENKMIDGLPVGQYVYYDLLLGNGMIPAGQGFWVQAYHSSPSLTITEKAKGGDYITYPQADTAVSHLVVKLQQGNKSDAAYMLFTSEATDGFDNLYDALKKPNEGMFNLSTRIGDNVDVAVNNLANSFCNKTVRLNIQNVSPGEYALAFDDLESLSDIGDVTVTDHFTGTTFTAGTTPYSFSITSNAGTSGPDRFTITFSRSQLDITTPKVLAADACREEDAFISIENSQPGVEYTALSENNDVISDMGIGNGETITVPILATGLTAGTNQVLVKAGFNGCTPQLITSKTEFTYTPPFEITVQEDISVCLGESAMLQAYGVPEGGHYRWFDENEVEIDSVTDGNIVTSPVWKETVFHVSGHHVNGCESESKSIHVYADTLEMPVITMLNDTLFTQVEANYQWKRNGVAIEGETLPYFKPVTSGNYTVVVFSSGCAKESEAYTYFVDPGCQVDIDTPVVTASNSCGEESVTITISNSQVGVQYFALNASDETISSTQTGTGGTITLELSTTVLDSGVNQVRIRADMEGCVDRVLASAVTINHIPVDMPVISVDNSSLVTNAVGTIQWKKDGEIITGATAQSLMPASSGSYTVTVTIGDCMRESDPYEFLVTATELPYSSEFELNTYPVPSSSANFRLSVLSPKADQVHIRIIDITGRLIFRKWYAFSELASGVPIAPDSGPLSDGVYVVIATQGRMEVRKRVVIRN